MHEFSRRNLGWAYCPQQGTDVILVEGQQLSYDNRTNHGLSVRRTAQVYSLSGLGRCGHCGGNMQIK